MLALRHTKPRPRNCTHHDQRVCSDGERQQQTKALTLGSRTLKTTIWLQDREQAWLWLCEGFPPPPAEGVPAISAHEHRHLYGKRFAVATVDGALFQCFDSHRLLPRDYAAS